MPKFQTKVDQPINRLPRINEPGPELVDDFDMEAAGVASWPAVATPTTRDKYQIERSFAIHVIGDGAGDGISQALTDDPASGEVVLVNYRIRVISGTINVKVNDGTADLIDNDHTSATTFEVSDSIVVSSNTAWVITIIASGGAGEFYLDYFSIRLNNTLALAIMNKATSNTPNDYSPNGNDGTLNSQPEPLVAGYDFDGIDDRVNADAGDAAKGSIVFWIAPDDGCTAVDSFNQRLVWGTNANRLEIQYCILGAIRFSVDNGGWTDLDTLQTTWASKTWYRVGVTWDGVTNRIYVNGVLDNSIADDAGSVALDFDYGGRAGQTHFDGKFKDCRNYKECLTAEWFEEDFALGVPDESLIFYTLDGSEDLSRYKHPLILVGDVIIGYPIEFDGNGDYIENTISITNALGNNITDLTVLFWFNANVTSGNDGLFNIGNMGGANIVDISLQSNVLFFRMASASFAETIAFTDKWWTQLALTYDGANGIGYLNGQEVVSGPFSTPLAVGSFRTNFGVYHSPPFPLDGRMTYIKILNKAKSADYILNDYETTRKYY